MFILIKNTLQSGLMQEALMANPYETLNVATALDRALKVGNKHKQSTSSLKFLSYSFKKLSSR